MTEGRVGFLCNIASVLSQNNETFKLLRSYYLMRCNELTKGYGLPRQQFSTKIRCPYCCLEWRSDTQLKVRPIKRSKRINKKMKSKQKSGPFKKRTINRASLRINAMEQTCTFCKKATATTLIKPEKEYIKEKLPSEHILKNYNQNKQVNQTLKKAENKNKNKKLTNTMELKKKPTVNVYSNAHDVFSLKNKKNTLCSMVKVPQKVITNSKKKKDKYAGLCQKAVLASAKLKQQHDIQNAKIQDQPLRNKLNLFLKPSSS